MLNAVFAWISIVMILIAILTVMILSAVRDYRRRREAPPIAPTTPEQDAHAASVEHRLAELETLRRRGRISDTTYYTRRQRILKEL